jgi:hypothetical protein
VRHSKCALRMLATDEGPSTFGRVEPSGRMRGSTGVASLRDLAAGAHD